MLPALRRRLALFAMALTFVSTAAPMPAQSDDAATGCLSKVQARGEPPVGGSAVVQICSAGRPVKDVSGVDLTNPAGVENPNGHLALGTILPVHTTIGSPAATVIDLESPTGVIARIYGGAQLKLLAQSDRSESYGDASGRTGYDVPPHRLDFMNVVTQALFAIVKGTDFDVNVGAGNTDVSVQRGLVATGRKLSVRVADQSSGVDCIKIVELVAAGESRTYAQTPDVKDFADRDAAHAYFADQIRAATANGDPTLIDAANSNATAFDTGVCPLDALAPAAAAAAVSHAAVAYGILGALALGGAALSVRNNTATPGPTPKPTASPTAVPTSTPSPAPTQTPSPTAAPTATPVPTPSPSPSPSPTPSPSATPAPTPTPSYGAVTLTPASQTLSPGIGMPATATFVATQPGYTGPFTATQPTCAESVGGTPVSSVSGSTISVTLQAQAAAISATCTVVVTGGGGMTAMASVSFVVTAAGAAARRSNRPLATPAPRMGSARA